MSETARGKIERAARIAAPVFAAHAWKWGIVDPFVPTEQDIVQQFAHLYDDVRKQGYMSLSCGRLTAKADSEGDVQLLLCLGDIFSDEH